MPEFVPYSQLLLRADYYIFPEGDPSRKSLCIEEPDVSEPVLCLPFNEEQEQQPYQVLREFPQIEQAFFQYVHIFDGYFVPREAKFLRYCGVIFLAVPSGFVLPRSASACRTELDAADRCLDRTST